MYSREDFQSIVVSQQEASAQDMDEQLSDEEDQAPISLQSSEDVRLWVPIEEALLLNDSAIKRELTMSMLKDQPSNVVALLQQARMNEDVEVVHYATVMLAELHKEYDLKIQELKQELLKQPDDIDILEKLQQYNIFTDRRRVKEILELLGSHSGISNSYCNLTLPATRLLPGQVSDGIPIGPPFL